MLNNLFLIKQEKCVAGYCWFSCITFLTAYLAPELICLAGILAFIFLMHEMGHLLVLKAYEQNWDSVGLGVGPLILQLNLPGLQLRVHAFWMGGGYFYSRAKLQDLTLFQQVVLWASGPLANILVMLGCIAVSVAWSSGNQWQLFAQLVPSIFNLVFSLLLAIANFDTNLEVVLSAALSRFAFLKGHNLSVHFIYLNITACLACLLGIYNLLPLPGSDGYKIVRCLLQQHLIPKLKFCCSEKTVVDTTLILSNLYVIAWGLMTSGLQVNSLVTGLLGFS